MSLVATVVWLRWRLLVGALRSRGSTLQVIGGVLFALLGTLVSIGIAFGSHALAESAWNAEDGISARLVVLVAFVGCALFGVVLPLLFHGGARGVDVSRLRPYPVRRSTLYTIVLGSNVVSAEHLFYYPTLAALFHACVLLPGHGTALGAAVFLSFAFCLVAWSHSVAMVAQIVLQGRRARELMVVVVLVVAMGLSLLPLAFGDYLEAHEDELAALARNGALGRLAAWTPPWLAADALEALTSGALDVVLVRLAGVAAWTIPALALGYLAFAYLHDGGRGSRGRADGPQVAREPRAPARASLLEPLALFVLPAPVVAVAVKDWRYMVRSPVGRFLLVIMPVLMVILGVGVARDLDAPVFGVDPTNAALYGFLLYVPLSLNVFVNNAFAWESRGVQSYFLSPVPLHAALFGKNLALWFYASLVGGACLVAFSAAVAVPSLAAVLNATLLYAAALLTCTVGGNLTSVAFPAARPISAMRNTLPGASLLVSLATMLVIAGQSALCLIVPLALGAPGLQTLFLAVLVVALLVAYAFGLRLAADWMSERREMLVDKLRPSE
jgi:hypothetical protein